MDYLFFLSILCCFYVSVVTGYLAVKKKAYFLIPVSFATLLMGVRRITAWHVYHKAVTHATLTNIEYFDKFWLPFFIAGMFAIATTLKIIDEIARQRSEEEARRLLKQITELTDHTDKNLEKKIEELKMFLEGHPKCHFLEMKDGQHHCGKYC